MKQPKAGGAGNRNRHCGPFKRKQAPGAKSHRISIRWLPGYGFTRIQPYSRVTPTYKEDYEDLAGFDKGTIKGHLVEKRFCFLGK